MLPAAEEFALGFGAVADGVGCAACDVRDRICGVRHCVNSGVFDFVGGVADGAGGLKVVDISDVVNPVILDGDDLSTALGTAEAVVSRNGHVYLAAGGAGVILYRNGNPLDCTVYPVDAAAEDMEWGRLSCRN